MPFQDLSALGMSKVSCEAIGLRGAAIRDMRARTSHTYSAAVAAQVAAGIPDFLAEADASAGPIATAPAMTARLDLREDHAAIVRNVLRAYLPAVRAPTFSGRAPMAGLDGIPTSIWRLNGTGRSDWNNWVRSRRRCPNPICPFKVDIVDLSLVDPAFKARIAANWIALTAEGAR